MAGEHLDLSSDVNSVPSADLGAKRFIGIKFACCGVYSRVYVNRDRSAYEGSCPKCSKCIRLGIDPNGSDSRFFTAY